MRFITEDILNNTVLGVNKEELDREVMKINNTKTFNKGKTHGKDIVLICKGRYNDDNYKTIKDAIIGYYHKHYGCEDITPDYGFINQVLLRPAVEEIMCDKFKYRFISCLFDTDCADIWKIDKMKTKELNYDEELYYRLIKFLGVGLMVKDHDGTILIDTSDYIKDENVI
jgi:hypothetical protein